MINEIWTSVSDPGYVTISETNPLKPWPGLPILPKLKRVELGDTTASANIQNDYVGRTNPDLVNWRFFGGLHFNLGVGGVYLGVQKSMLKNQYAANLGLNLFY